jgi:hypothetical protein
MRRRTFLLTLLGAAFAPLFAGETQALARVSSTGRGKRHKRSKTKKLSGTFEGKVTGSSKKSVTVKSSKGTGTLKVTKHTSITVNGKHSTPQELEVGTKVSVTANKGVAESITVGTAISPGATPKPKAKRKSKSKRKSPPTN